jgi:amidase
MGDTDITTRTARSLAAAIRAREISPTELLEACLGQVDAVNGDLAAVVWRNDDDARQQARRATEAVVHSDPDDLPPFFGVPMPIKDLTPVEGWPVTYGSWGAPEGPSAESELIVEAFQRAGFLLTGRTNTPEFGPITVAENSRYGITRNPWNREHTPGGSSGGAAASVAAGMFPVAHANDGGGSIRIPASCCGLVGLKVSRGRVPAHVTAWEGGAVEGVVTRDVADTAAILDVVCGPDRGLWYNAPAPERPFAEVIGQTPRPLRIGVVGAAPLDLPVDAECIDGLRQAARTLEGLGHKVESAEVGMPPEMVDAFMSVVNSGLADYDGIDWSRTEPHIQANRQKALGIDSLEYVAAVHKLQRFTRHLSKRWGDEFDILLTPTMSILPPKAGVILAGAHADPDQSPPLEVFQMAIFTSPFNITGFPAISLPVHVTEQGLPVGVQLVAGPWEEALLLQISAQLEQTCGWVDRRPPLIN